MKYSFHVSTMPEFWQRGLKKKYIAEPYVAHFYRLSVSDDVQIAAYTRTNESDYKNDCAYLADKVEHYRDQLIKNLNQLHETDYSSAFWTKALGMGFNRFVHMMYDGYKIASQFDPEQHEACILDKNSYCQFQDFEEFRELFQRNNFGFEQMFSLYVHTFHMDIAQKNSIKANCNQSESMTPVTVQVKKFGILSRWKRLTLRQLYHRLLKKIFFWNKPVVGVFYSYFSREHMDELYRKSHVRIDPINFNYKYKADKPFDQSLRLKLLTGFDSNDRFDFFFQKAIEEFFPTLYIESFQKILSYFQNEAQKYQKLKYVISEAWIGDSRMSFFLAVLQMQGIFHIYNEHNYLQQFFLGNHIAQLVKMCDQYYTLGWYNKKYNKLKSGASLFSSFSTVISNISSQLPLKPLSESSMDVNKEIDYLYISAYPAVKLPEINCAYGQNQENAPRYMEFVGRFFDALSDEVLSKLIFRFYPTPDNWLEYDFKHLINSYSAKIKGNDNINISSKQQILKSRLVIIDYLSTSYLEALIMNVPSIILFDQSRYYLEEEYDDFFKSLIEVGICQVSSNDAAQFINQMGDNIEQWWFCQSVQDARRKFLDLNIGDQKDAIQYYLSLLKQKG